MILFMAGLTIIEKVRCEVCFGRGPHFPPFSSAMKSCCLSPLYEGVAVMVQQCTVSLEIFSRAFDSGCHGLLFCSTVLLLNNIFFSSFSLLKWKGEQLLAVCNLQMKQSAHFFLFQLKMLLVCRNSQ